MKERQCLPLCVCVCMTVPEPACASQLKLCCSPCCQADFGHMTIRQWLLQLWITTSLNQRWPEEERRGGGGNSKSRGNEQREWTEGQQRRCRRENNAGRCGNVWSCNDDTSIKNTRWVMRAPCTTYLFMLCIMPSTWSSSCIWHAFLSASQSLKSSLHLQ